MEFDEEEPHQTSQETSDFSFEQSNQGKKKRKSTKKKKSHKKSKASNEQNTSSNLENSHSENQSQSQSQNESQKEIKEIKEETNKKDEKIIKEENLKEIDDRPEENIIDKTDVKENENKEEKKEEEKEEEKTEEKKEEKKENEEKLKEENKGNEKEKTENKEQGKIEDNTDKNNNEEKEKEKEKESEQDKVENNNNKVEEKKEEEKEEKKIEQEKPKENTQYQGPKKISEFDLINQDPYLKNFEWAIKRRNEHFKNILHQIESNEKSLENFSNSYQNMGLHVLPNGDIKYREYAPGAKGIALFGEFNNWNRDQYWAKRDEYGFWELIIPNEDGKPRIKHKTKVKSNVVLSNGQWADRNPIWIEYLYQNTQSLIFDGVFWNPEQKYQWKYPKKHLPKPKSLRIYEAHVGMSSFYPKITTYKDFMENILPRVKRLGYTAVQLMAIMHHANYASFGYHVNNFFAISSLFGTPEELMELIDKAHEMGLFMIMDIVHSHASSNVDDGFNNWDGTDYLYFHGG